MNGAVARTIMRLSRIDGRPGVKRAIKKAYTRHEPGAIKLVRMARSGNLPLVKG
jgi:hypothetical protein